TENFGLLDWRFLAFEESVERCACVARFYEIFALIIIDATLITKNTLLIKNKSVRRSDGTVLFGNGFGGAIVEIWEIKIFVRRANFHRFESVIEICVTKFVEPDTCCA